MIRVSSVEKKQRFVCPVYNLSRLKDFMYDDFQSMRLGLQAFQMIEERNAMLN